MIDYKVVSAKQKDIELLTSIKMVTMLDDELDKKLSFDEKEKIKNNIVLNIEQNYKNYKIIYVDKEIAGAYAIVNYEDGKMIDEIYLFDEYRNNGIGTDIVNNLVVSCRYLYVWLNKNNVDAVRFFERLNFNKVSSGRTLIYKYDFIENRLLNKLNIKLGYRDKNGKCFIEPNKNFKEEYYLQSPKDVLNSKLGYVFDQVELERYLLDELKIDCRSYFMVYSSSENEMSHAFIVFNDNDKYYWLENAWIKYKGIHEYESKEELLNDVVKKFVATIKDGNVNKTRLYQFDKPSYGINYNKYVKHCLSGISIKVSKGK